MVLVTRHLGKFQLSDAVLGTERATKIDDDVVDGFGDAIRLLEESLFVAADRLGDVVVDIAVTTMAKSDRSGTGDQTRDCEVRGADKCWDAADWNGDIVLDASALMRLGLNNGFTNFPEIRPLCAGLSEGGVDDLASFKALSQHFLHGVSHAAVCAGTGELDQSVLVIDSI